MLITSSQISCNSKFWTCDGLYGKQSGSGQSPVISTPVVAQFTAFDGVIIAASISSWAAKRSSLML
jgi:hypothetical protein